MTRRELIDILKSDETKLDEEVVWEDLEYSRFYPVDSVDSHMMDILPNQEMVLQSVKPYEKFGHKNSIGEKIVTIIS